MSKLDKISEAVGRRGLMLVLSSPSGAGKTSIARRLLDEDDNLTLSVSATTRPPRANEVDGRDYHFVDQERFDRMVAQDEFLEYATVFSNSYGTPKADVMSALERGEDVLFDIDWQGTQQVANAARAACSIASVTVLAEMSLSPRIFLESHLRSRSTRLLGCPLSDCVSSVAPGVAGTSVIDGAKRQRKPTSKFEDESFSGSYER